jgi:hypothetical protein
MSEDTTAKFMEETTAMFESHVDSFTAGFMDNFKDILKESSEASKKRIEECLKDAGKFQWKSETSKDPALAEEYKQASEEALEVAKAIILGEGVVIYNETANVLLEGFKATIKSLAGALKVAVEAAVAGAGKGLLKAFLPI